MRQFIWARGHTQNSIVVVITTIVWRPHMPLRSPTNDFRYFNDLMLVDILMQFDILMDIVAMLRCSK